MIDYEEFRQSKLADKIRHISDYVHSRVQELESKITQTEDINNIATTDFAKYLQGTGMPTFDDLSNIADEYYKDIAERKKQTQSLDERIADSKSGITTIKEYPNGLFMVELTTAKALEFEGTEMGICVGEESYIKRLGKPGNRFFSLRSLNKDGVFEPHATISIESGRFSEIKGKANKNIKGKYIAAVRDFISGDVIRQFVPEIKNTNVPDSEKEYLGYVNSAYFYNPGPEEGKVFDLHNLPPEGANINTIGLYNGDQNYINFELLSVSNIEFRETPDAALIKALARFKKIENLKISYTQLPVQSIATINAEKISFVSEKISFAESLPIDYLLQAIQTNPNTKLSVGTLTIDADNIPGAELSRILNHIKSTGITIKNINQKFFDEMPEIPGNPVINARPGTNIDASNQSAGDFYGKITGAYKGVAVRQAIDEFGVLKEQTFHDNFTPFSVLPKEINFDDVKEIELISGRGTDFIKRASQFAKNITKATMTTMQITQKILDSLPPKITRIDTNCTIHKDLVFPDNIKELNLDTTSIVELGSLARQSKIKTIISEKPMNIHSSENDVIPPNHITVHGDVKAYTKDGFDLSNLNMDGGTLELRLDGIFVQPGNKNWCPRNIETLKIGGIRVTGGDIDRLLPGISSSVKHLDIYSAITDNLDNIPIKVLQNLRTIRPPKDYTERFMETVSARAPHIVFDTKVSGPNPKYKNFTVKEVNIEYKDNLDMADFPKMKKLFIEHSDNISLANLPDTCEVLETKSSEVNLSKIPKTSKLKSVKLSYMKDEAVDIGALPGTVAELSLGRNDFDPAQLAHLVNLKTLSSKRINDYIDLIPINILRQAEISSGDNDEILASHTIDRLKEKIATSMLPAGSQYDKIKAAEKWRQGINNARDDNYQIRLAAFRIYTANILDNQPTVGINKIYNKLKKDRFNLMMKFLDGLMPSLSNIDKIKRGIGIINQDYKNHPAFNEYGRPGRPAIEWMAKIMPPVHPQLLQIFEKRNMDKSLPIMHLQNSKALIKS